ncbi:MAG: class I SAM-dependent methyltransferase [Alphaproteobacteria bacterium]|nr:class I SAM-dependent methyltransferase [Alphaproteobacteria bacterium]
MKKLIYALIVTLLTFAANPLFAMEDAENFPSHSLGVSWPKETHAFGVPGTDPELPDHAAEIVKQYPLSTIEEGEIPTLNKMGAIVKTPGFFADQFIEFASRSSLPALSVGETGNVAWPALEKSITFIANDLDSRHLAHLYVNTPKEKLSSLYLKAGKFPDDVLIPDESLGSIYLGRMLHFMTGKEIENSFKKSYSLLLPGGKLFARATSPFQIHLQFFLPTFEKRLTNKESWPGICTEIERGWPTVHPYLPSFMNLLDVDTLKLALENAGFFIEKIGYHPINHPEFKLDGREAVGFIAEKK